MDKLINLHAAALTAFSFLRQWTVGHFRVYRQRLTIHQLCVVRRKDFGRGVHNRVSLHPYKLDRFGVPLMRFDVTFCENELRLMNDSRTEGEAMLKKAGMSNVTSVRGEHVTGGSIHEMGRRTNGR
jgi:hypothetical protein